MSVDPSHVRVPIEDVRPCVHRGLRPAKAVVGEAVEITARVFVEGSRVVGAAALLHAPDGRTTRRRTMRELAPGTDRWAADVTPDAIGRWSFTVEAWTDPMAAWQRDAVIKVQADVDTGVTLEEGIGLFDRALAQAPDEAARSTLATALGVLRDDSRSPLDRLAAATAPQVRALLSAHPLRERLTESAPLPLLVERERALFGSWYEFFPRSEGAVVREGRPPQSGTLRTAAERL
ncbi:maltotransferase domain-containing protein, partial [Streptomyces sp. NPDC058672]